MISVISGYDPLTGLIDYRTAGTGAPYTNRQNLSFAWDKNGNLKTRVDANQANLTEEFFHDPLNRLDYAQRNGVTTLDLAYVANGNIATRAEGGMFYTYGYGAKPHAVMQVQYACDCTCLTDDYGYDANGNMTSRLGSSISWYSYDLPNIITQGSSYSSQFAYTPDRRRWQQVAHYGATTETTIYVGGILEKVTRGSVTEYKHYIPAGKSSTALHTRRSNGTSATYYLTRDHLGSGTAVMDANGASLVNLSFGALGSRRGAAWQDVPSTDDWTQITATTRHGFTGHEHLDNLSLIHMNGRAYDPKLGRFLSGDPVYVGNLADPQSLNPYSYVGNRPLSATDPTGLAAIGSLSETTVSAEFGLLGQLANLDQAISQYRAALGTWAAGCRAALGSCNDVAPDVSGILGAASGVVSAGNALQRQINDAESNYWGIKQEQWAEADAWAARAAQEMRAARADNKARADTEKNAYATELVKGVPVYYLIAEDFLGGGVMTTRHGPLMAAVGDWWDIRSNVQRAKLLGEQERSRWKSGNDIGDAMRHAEWMRRTTQETNAFTAWVVGTGYEIRGLLGGQPTNQMLMDLHNNAVGRHAGSRGTPIDTDRLWAIPGPGYRYMPYQDLP